MDGITSRTSCRVLLGIDGSESSLRALAYAVGTAKRMDASLLAVYVQPGIPAQVNDQAAVETLLDGQAEMAVELRSEVTRTCFAAGVRHEFLIEHGDPFVELRRLAQAADVDAVLIGASMQARHRILPSIASRLVRSAHWPVTVVP